MSVFGRIITDDQIEDAVIASLRKWTPTWLTEVEQQLGLEPGYYERPADSSYLVRDDFDKWPEEMLPAVVVVSLGPLDEPVKDGRWSFRERWLMGILGVAGSTDQVSSRRAAYRLGAAIRGVLAGRQTLDGALDGTVRGVYWQGGRNSEMPPDAERTIWAQRQAFAIEIGDVLRQAHGPPAPEAEPLEPSTEPWPDDPVAGAGQVGSSVGPWTAEP